jgi:hypothetical protein
MPRRITVDDARAQIERDRLANVARMPALKADAKTAAQDARAELEVRTAPKLPPETVFRFRKAVRFRVDVMPTALDTIRAELRNDVASGSTTVRTAACSSNARRGMTSSCWKPPGRPGRYP